MQYNITFLTALNTKYWSFAKLRDVSKFIASICKKRMKNISKLHAKLKTINVIK